MSDYYKGKIKVIGVDMMCFPVDPVTLESLSCGCYDPYAWTDMDTDAVENIGIGAWEVRCGDMREKEWVEYYRIRNKGLRI